jgi:hypothetical protein
MAKGLPYFKFTPSEWLTGEICFEDLETQGLFINICAWYWQRDGVLTVSDILKRYNKPTAFNSLSSRFLNIENDTIKIAFLDEQLIERNHTSKVNSKNGSMGGRPKTKEEKPTAFNSVNETKANENPIRKEEEENKNKNLMVNGKVVYWEVFYNYAKSIKEFYKPELDYSLKTTYTEWAELDGYLSSGRQIKEWKKTLRNTMPHLKPVVKEVEETETEYKRRMWFERNGGNIERQDN